MSLAQISKIFFNSFILSFFVCISLCFGQSTWEEINPHPAGNLLKFVAFGKGLFLAAGDSGTILSSTNCTTWINKNMGATYGFSFLTNSNGQFWAERFDTSYNGEILASSDGITWTPKNSGPPYLIISLTFVTGLLDAQADQFVGVGAGMIATSLNGTTWITKLHGNGECLVCTTDYFSSVTYGNGLIVAVGGTNVPNPDAQPGQPYTPRIGFGIILTSSDGITWIENNKKPPLSWLKSVIYCNGQFVAIGMNGIILTSPDGITWTQNNLVPLYSMYSVTYGNSQFIAVGEQGAIFVSPNGTTWTQINSGTTNNLFSVTYGNGQFVAVGEKGTILVSKADPVGVAFQTKTKSNVSGQKISIFKNCISAILPGVTTHSQLKIELFNISGKQIYSATTKAQNGVLNIPAKQFPTGKYFISITDEKNRTLNSAFVLTR
jgi:Secretion system C-terminal sorting domain